MTRTILLVLLAVVAFAGLLATDAQAVYHLRLGRFLQRDPAGYADGADFYQYTRSRPVRLTDPKGKEGTEPCCAKIEGTRTHLHATVEAKRGKEVERIYAHPEDSDVGDSWVYPYSSESVSISVTEGRSSSDNLCQWSATIYGSTGPDRDWAGWVFQLSAEARYSIVVTNLACETGRLQVTCSGTGMSLSTYYCPSFGTYHVPEGGSRRLEGKPWVGLPGRSRTWSMPAEERHEGTAWIVLKVSCE